MNLLPEWVLPPTLPAVYDCESSTALEMVSKLYGAVNELITEYNKTVEQLNGFQEEEKAAREEFELKITKVIRQFICDIERKFVDLDGLAKTLINDAIVAGNLAIAVDYDQETESLNIVTGGEL